MTPIQRCTLCFCTIVISCGIARLDEAAERTWIEVRSPNFVVNSDASPGEARRTARKFEQFRSVIQTVMPKLRVDPGTPLIVFAARDANSLKSLLPKLFQQKGVRLPAGIFQSGPEKNFVVLRIDEPGEQSYHVIYHEYVHMLMRINFGSLPVWLSEGLAEFFGHATLADGKSGLGRPSEEQLALLRESSFLSLDVLLSVNHDSPYYREEQKTRIFYAQAWALTHYLMIGDNRAHAKQLLAFLDLVLQNVPEQEAARRAFGDLKVLQQKLEEYVRSMGFYYFTVGTQLSVREEQYSSRALSLPEVLASRGDLFVHTNRLDEAQALLEQALQLDSRSAAANEGMGMLCLRRQDRAQAQKYFSAAADLNSGSCMTHYYAARSSWEQGGEGGLKAAESYLREAITINSKFAPAYDMLSQILVQNNEKRPEALELAKRTAELEPGNLNHQVNVARILLVMDRMEEARSLGQRILAAARTSAERMVAEGLISSIDRRQRQRIEAQAQADQLRARTREMEQRRPAAEPPPAQPSKPMPPLLVGAAAVARGLIRAAKCEYPAILDIVLESNGKQLKFRARNYYQVQFGAVGRPERNDFQPCSELEGRFVEVGYLSVLNQEFVGLIQSVTIEK